MNVCKEIQSHNGKHLILNPDARVVGNIVRMCVMNGGYCPCKPQRIDDLLCPCKSVREAGVCCCHLYLPNMEEKDDVQREANS